MSARMISSPLTNAVDRPRHRMVYAMNGGPIRLILGKGTTHRTGTFIAVKADYRSMPWESHKCELGVLQMAEVASGVVSLMAQPHRLELSVSGRREPLIYFPDLELRVDRTFFNDLIEDRRFADVTARPRFGSWSNAETCKVVIEVKHEDDARIEDEDYLHKLALAEEFYRSRGILFKTICRKKDFDTGDIPRFELLTLDRHTRLDPQDYVDLRRIFAERNGNCKYGIVLSRLGGGPAGIAKIACLHINRKISIDLRRPLSDDSEVYLLS